MKKLSLVALLATSALFAASDAQIRAFYENRLPENVIVTVESREQTKEAAGYETVFVKLSDGIQTQTDIIFTKDDFMFLDIVDLKNDKFLKGEIEKTLIVKQLGAVYKAEPKENIITIGNDKKKETLVIFTDPECPYCRTDLENIDEKLKTNNLKIIITSVNDQSALQKAHHIYDETKKAKTDAAKIAILKKYYDEKVVVTPNPAQTQAMDELRRKYLSSGLKGVPFSVNEKELLK